MLNSQLVNLYDHLFKNIKNLTPGLMLWSCLYDNCSKELLSTIYNTMCSFKLTAAAERLLGSPCLPFFFLQCLQPLLPSQAHPVHMEHGKDSRGDLTPLQSDPMHTVGYCFVDG